MAAKNSGLMRPLLPSAARAMERADTKAYQIEGEVYGLPIKRNSPFRVSQNISRRNRKA